MRASLRDALPVASILQEVRIGKGCREEQLWVLDVQLGHGYHHISVYGLEHHVNVYHHVQSQQSRSQLRLLPEQVQQRFALDVEAKPEDRVFGLEVEEIALDGLSPALSIRERRIGQRGRERDVLLAYAKSRIESGIGELHALRQTADILLRQVVEGSVHLEETVLLLHLVQHLNVLLALLHQLLHQGLQGILLRGSHREEEQQLVLIQTANAIAVGNPLQSLLFHIGKAQGGNGLHQFLSILQVQREARLPTLRLESIDRFCQVHSLQHALEVRAQLLHILGLQSQFLNHLLGFEHHHGSSISRHHISCLVLRTHEIPRRPSPHEEQSYNSNRKFLHNLFLLLFNFDCKFTIFFCEFVTLGRKNICRALQTSLVS